VDIGASVSLKSAHHTLVLNLTVVCSFVVTIQKLRHLISVLCCRKILSPDAEATKQNVRTDETMKEDENPSSVPEGCNGDSVDSSSAVNVPLQKPDGGDTHVENVENGQAPNVGCELSNTKDSVPDVMETSTSVSQADADSVSGNDPNSHTLDDNSITTQCSAVSAEQSSVEEKADQEHSNTDVDTVASASANDSDKHTAEACSGAELEQTDSLAGGDCTSSDVGRDSLPSGQLALSEHCDSDDKISMQSAGDSCPSLGAALMNEVF